MRIYVSHTGTSPKKHRHGRIAALRVKSVGIGDDGVGAFNKMNLDREGR